MDIQKQVFLITWWMLLRLSKGMYIRNRPKTEEKYKHILNMTMLPFLFNRAKYILESYSLIPNHQEEIYQDENQTNLKKTFYIREKKKRTAKD